MLGGRFFEVVRGLTTLRVHDRAEAQVAVLEQVGEDYRRETMSTLRLAFLSALVLELAAALGVAMVAVALGVRLVDGGIGLQASLAVLILAPEIYQPIRAAGRAIPCERRRNDRRRGDLRRARLPRGA